MSYATSGRNRRRNNRVNKKVANAETRAKVTDDEIQGEFHTALTLAGFTNLSRIGSGVTGTVYSITHARGFVCAVKLVIDSKDQALAEISCLKECQSIPQIVQIYDWFSGHDYVAIVLEVLSCTLHDFIQRHKEISEAVAMGQAYDIFNGLEYIHSRGIIHCDLKPQNIMHDFEGSLKLVDFSLSHKGVADMEGRVWCALSANHELVTMWYRSPELILGADVFTAAIDIFAAGAILFELLTGRVAFPGNSEIGTLFKIFQRMGAPDNESSSLRFLKHYSKNFPKFPEPDHIMADEALAAKLAPCNHTSVKSFMAIEPEHRPSASLATSLCSVPVPRAELPESHAQLIERTVKNSRGLQASQFLPSPSCMQ